MKHLKRLSRSALHSPPARPRQVPDLRKLEEDARREELQGRVLDRWIQEGTTCAAGGTRRAERQVRSAF